MREWYAASALVGLPGLPGTHQRINATAKRKGWRSRPRAGRGGGREYHISALPESARVELLWRESYPSLAQHAHDLAGDAGLALRAWANGDLETIPFLLQLVRSVFGAAKLRAQLKGERHA